MEKIDELKEEIKNEERKFLINMENLIKNQYSPWLHGKYLISLQKIRDCYGNNDMNLSQSHECAQKISKKYHELEWHFERILRKYEDGISHCVGNCSKEFQPVIFIFNLMTLKYKYYMLKILECYNDCFKTFSGFLEKRLNNPLY